MSLQSEISEFRSQLDNLADKLDKLENQMTMEDDRSLHTYEITLRLTTDPDTWGLSYGPELTPQDVKDSFLSSIGSIMVEMGFVDEGDNLEITEVKLVDSNS